LGVKLGHVLWRKHFPDEREIADDNLINHTYELIDNGKYRLAIRLLDFVCTDFKKFSSEERQLILVVNRALAYKYAGDVERSKKIMRAIDWSAKGDKFKLADAVLSLDWKNAAYIMKRIGNSGTVTKNQYADWPLFCDWRKEELFLSTYAEIFGETFSVKAEVVSQPAANHGKDSQSALPQEPYVAESVQ
jgi:hypothetical protein